MCMDMRGDENTSAFQMGSDHQFGIQTATPEGQCDLRQVTWGSFKQRFPSPKSKE